MDSPVPRRRGVLTRRLLLGGVGAAGIGAALNNIGFMRMFRTAAELAPESLIPGGTPDPLIDRRGLMGAPVSRVDGPLKVQGAARYAAEVPLEGLVYAAFAFSTIAKGRIATLDTSAAERAAGVVLVMTHKNVPALHKATAEAGDQLVPMQDDRIYWNGQPIAVVLAETQEHADHASSLIEATYETEPAITTFTAAKARARRVPYFGEPLYNRIGDADTALAAAPFKVDQVYRTPFQNHNAMELHAATLAWSGEELTVHDCTQSIRQTTQAFAKNFGLKEEQIHVSVPFVGGGFGGK
jgi:xanthine dehydrogenase YagR molybdenum-binding subunit